MKLSTHKCEAHEAPPEKIRHFKGLLKDVSERALEWQSTKGTASGGIRTRFIKGKVATDLQVGE